MAEIEKWSDDLRATRQALRLSQAGLARLAGISAEAVHAYETGRRTPSRKALVSILDALKLERRARDDILVGAGFAPDGLYLSPARYLDYNFFSEQAQEHIDGTPWPAFVVDDVLEVVVANQLVQCLWGVDLRREFTEPSQRNMLALASNPRFADRVSNWDEMIAVAVAIFKGHHLGPEDLSAPSAFFNQVLATFAAGDPRYVSRFLEVWQKTPPRTPKVRWWYPVVWRDGDATMRFRGLVTSCDEPHGLAFNDWIPTDTATWAAIDRLTGRP